MGIAFGIRLPGDAHAQTTTLPPVVGQNLDAITSHTYGHSPISAPSLPDPNNVLTVLEDKERIAAQAENKALSQQLWDDFNRAARKAKLTKFVKAGGIVSLAATTAAPCLIKHGYRFWKCVQGSESVPTYELFYYGVDGGTSTPFNSGWWTGPPEGGWVVRHRTEGSTSAGTLTAYTSRYWLSGKLPDCAAPSSYIPSQTVWDEATKHGTVTLAESWDGSFTKNGESCTSHQDGYLVYAPPEAVLGEASPSASSAPAGATVIDVGVAPPDPGPTSVRSDIEAFLRSAEGQELARWYDWALGTPGATNPYTGERNPIRITVPSCDGLTFDPCAQHLRDAGFTGTITRQTETFEAADVTKPADSVLDTNPTAGSQVDDTGDVVIRTNPTDADMPRLVPELTYGAGYSAYEAELQTRDLVPVRETLSETNYDHNAGAAISVNPSQGTRVRKDTEVRVVANPDTDARASTAEDERCRLSTPLDADPATDRSSPYQLSDHAALYEQYATEGDPNGAFKRKTGDFATDLSGGVDTFLRWGWTETISPPLKWAGWGYRHIAAKHGWAAADQLATQVALNLPPVKIDGTTYVYDGPDYPGLAGAICRRRVVVQTAPTYANVAKEIITSYGRIQDSAQ